jgi:hypothetical protein
MKRHDRRLPGEERIPMKRIWILLGLVVVIGGAIYVVVKLADQTDQGIAHLPEEPVSQISILSPAFGQQFELGSPVVVDAFAYAAAPIASVELWIDGQHLGEQDAPGDGELPFTPEFLWFPQNEGIHTLIVRAFDAEGPVGFSPAVNVLILESEEGGAANDHSGMNVPAVLPAADRPGDTYPPDPGEAILPAIQLDGNPDFDNAQTIPNAPELIGQVEGCSVELRFHDLSDNEAGFNVYRQASNAMTPVKVATLEPGEGQGWFEFIDMAYPGGFTYFVTAFNGQGESPSNPVVVNIPSADCDMPEGGQQAFGLDLGALLADSGANLAYCYRSLDGNHWDRIPREGFIIPGMEGQDDYIAIGELVGPQYEPITLTLECWGWYGEVLELIGTFQDEFELGSVEEIGPQINESIFGNALELVPMDGSFGFYAAEGDFEIIPDIFADFAKLMIHDPTLPLINASISYDPDVCKSHLMPDAQNLLGQILFCTPYPGFDSGDEGGNPQPYLVWDMGSACGAGEGIPPCFPYESWESLAEDVGGNVWFTITDQSNAGHFSHIVDAPYLQNFTIPPVACSGTRVFHLSMYYSDNSNIYFSLPSNVVSINCPQPLPYEIPIDITFNTINFWSLDDGESDPEDVEVYGYLRAAVTGGPIRYLNLADWDQQADHCPDESAEWIGNWNSMGTLVTDGCTKTFRNGVSNLADVALCHGTSKTNCSLLGWGFDHNTIQVLVTDWDSITISMSVIDWDDASGNDLQCSGSISIPARDRFDWAQVQDLPFHLESSDNGNGGCAIDGVINAVVP